MHSFSELSIIIPTFYPGPIINSCLDTLPEEADIIIVDNGDDQELDNLLKLKKHNIRHFKIGDVGLPKSFNFGLKKSKNENILITQPDVSFEKNCISELLNATKKYQNVGLFAPIVYENKQYSQYNSLELNLTKSGFIRSKKNKFRAVNKKPSGDFCVEAVNATAMLLNRNILKKIGGWDESIYTYLEDIDLCIKLRRMSLSILKINNAVVHHVGFGSHKIENTNKSELSRNWHFCWSSLYFRQKYYSKKEFRKYFVKMIFKYFIKTLINIFLMRLAKFKKNFIRLKACLNYLTIKKSNFRV